MKADILMPVFSTPVEWAKEAVASIRAQAAEGYTLVLVDDNNPPGELRDFLYEQAAMKCCTRIVRTPENRGVAAALNAGLKECTGDIVIRMDADDIAHKDLVAKHQEYFTKYKDRHICGVQVRMFGDGRSRLTGHPERITRSLAFNRGGFWFVNHPGICYRRTTVMSVDGYGDIPAALAEDYALWVKFLLKGYTIYNRSECLVDYRVHRKTFATAPDRHAPEWFDFLKQQRNLLR